MKHPTGYAKPRRLATPKAAGKAAPKKKARLDLKRSPAPEPEEEIDAQRQSDFGRWVLLVALLHLLVIGIFYFVYEMSPSQKPPEQFISLLPDGDVVKGTAGKQEAHKLGPSTPAAAVHHSSPPPPPPAAAAIQPPKPPTPTPPKPLPKPQLKLDAPPMLTEKPVEPPKPVPPKPKVKVDLTLADGPTPDKPAIKPKPHVKKPVVKPDDSNDQDTAAKADSTGLSKEEIAAKLGDKLDAAGVKNATHTGTSGSANAHPNDFSDFYAAIRDQVMSQWQSPNLSDETAVNPIVEIHVEKDGRVPPESVHLIQSSGNSSYDDSAIEAAKGLGYLHEPLPEGCNPDIPITFKLTR